MPSFSVAVSCPSGKGKGMAKECPREDQPFTLEGCEPIPCKSPTSGPGTAGYMVCLGRNACGGLGDGHLFLGSPEM